MGDREAGEGGQVLTGVSNHGGHGRELRRQHHRDLVDLLDDFDGGGLGKDGADGCSDHLGRGLGTRASTFLRKWTRHRCHEAPAMTAAMAALSPVWASEMTSCTPARPRALSERRNAVQNAPSSLSPTSGPSTSRPPSTVTPVAITTARDTTRPSTRALR